MDRFKAGDVTIRRTTGTDSFELHDTQTGDLLAVRQTLRGALDLAATRGGAVWRHNTDSRGRPMGEPALLQPRIPKLD